MLDMVQPPVPDAKFKRLVTQWAKELGDPLGVGTGPDQHCINYQIYTMLLDVGTFRMVKRAVELSSDEKNQLPRNTLFHRFIVNHYIQVQIISLRKLTEPRKKPSKKKDTSVYSLNALVREISENRQLFTRHNMFGVRGMCLDAEACAANERSRELAIPLGTVSSVHIERSHDAYWVRDMHSKFNELAGFDAHRTAPDDRLPDALFDYLIDETEWLSWPYDYSNKYVAHAARDSSRRELPEEHRTLSFEKMNLTIERLCKLVSFVDTCLVRHTSTYYLPTITGDPCEYMDRPLVESQHLDDLRREWRAFDAEVAKWSENPRQWPRGRAPKAPPAAPGTRIVTAGDPATG